MYVANDEMGLWRIFLFSQVLKGFKYFNGRPENRSPRNRWYAMVMASRCIPMHIQRPRAYLCQRESARRPVDGMEAFEFLYISSLRTILSP